MWHILDEWAEVVIKSQPHKNAGGVAAEVACGLYRLPTEESITAGRERAQEELRTLMATQQHTVSPRRGQMRVKAAAAQAKQGREMQQRAKGKHGGAVAVGTLVQVAVDNVDRAKTDDTNATLVVVEVVQKGTKQVEDKYRLACAFLGQLRPSILSPILSGEYASETYSGGSARRGRARAVPPLCTE